MSGLAGEESLENMALFFVTYGTFHRNSLKQYEMICGTRPHLEIEKFTTVH
jgi:hypothetical protein